jgi:hypothetical protein
MPGTVIQGHFPHGLGRIPRAQRQTGNAVELPQTMTAFGNLPGHPLPPVVRQKMEALFGTNFNDVRIHTGMHATQFGATAFTHGSNIRFAPGHYDPNSARGQHAPDDGAYSWVDSTMSWLGQDADGGTADVIASTYQRYVLGETIKTTGRVAVGGRTGSNASTNTAMGGISASNAAGRASKAAADSRHHYEWLHLKAGKTARRRTRKRSMRTRGPVSIGEMRLLENAATTALADNDGVGGLWSAARRFLPFH